MHNKLHIKIDWKPGDVLFEGAVNGEKITLQIDRKGLRAWSDYRYFRE